jgi:poly-gamma-glutamate capsule biosynthesis protein CapA/YwtB (metallophosphatase superfamily)
MCARDYATLAESRNGPIAALQPQGYVQPDYVWGSCLDVLAAHRPDVRIVNLENTISEQMAPWAGKSIHYKVDNSVGYSVCVVSSLNRF